VSHIYCITTTTGFAYRPPCPSQKLRLSPYGDEVCAGGDLRCECILRMHAGARGKGGAQMPWQQNPLWWLLNRLLARVHSAAAADASSRWLQVCVRRLRLRSVTLCTGPISSSGYPPPPLRRAPQNGGAAGRRSFQRFNALLLARRTQR
jgi:hypothetical protein